MRSASRPPGPRLPTLPLFDLLLTMLASLVGLTTVLMIGMRMNLRPLEDDVRRDLDGLRAQADGRSGAPLAMPPVVPEDDLVGRLAALGRDSRARDAALLAALNRAVQDEYDFWNARMSELCDDATRPEMPSAAAAPNAPDAIARLKRVGAARAAIWKAYEHCQVEQPKVFADDCAGRPDSECESLAFTTGSHDDFDTAPDEVRKRAASLVTSAREHITAGRTKIIVRGHTDPEDVPEYNLELSFNRARHIARWIREGLQPTYLERRDYLLIIEGAGESRLPPRASGVSDDAYYRSCRRVEVAFQRPDELEKQWLSPSP